jgi:hypothetical protein
LSVRQPVFAPPLDVSIATAEVEPGPRRPGCSRIRAGWEEAAHYYDAPGANAVLAAPAQPGSESRLWRGLRWLPALLGVVLIAAIGGWLLGRGNILVLQTPSMGTAAPAGSLVLTRPLGAAPLRRGMIVAFHVPASGQVYMHRVWELLPDGRFRTRGDLNSSPDGWELTRAAVVGVPVAIVPGLGWLVIALPWVLVAIAAGLLLALLLPRYLRSAVRSLTVGAAIALPLYVVKPLVRVSVTRAGSVLSAAHKAQRLGPPHPLDGGAAWPSIYHPSFDFLARLVNGGLLPLRVSLRATHTVIDPGHAGVITAELARHTVAALSARPALPPWAWLLVALLVIAPLPVGLLGLGEPIATAHGAGRARGGERSTAVNPARSPADNPA